jgi:hypothetical protein
MNKTWLIAIISGTLALIAVYAVIVLLLVKLLWSISWYTAFKIGVFVAVLAGLAGVRRGRES